MKLDDLPQPTEETVVAPDQLEVDGENPNEQSDAMFGLLCDNMRQKGWLGNAIIADTDGLIADGEHRWRAAQEIGLEEVPVKFYDIDDAERRLWRQELNKISGEHDKKRDALEYQELLNSGKSDDVDELVNATGEDLDELLAEIRVDNSLPPAYEYDPEHNVYFEDCVEGMRERLEDNSVDMVFTSPPYNIGKDSPGPRSSAAVSYTDEKTHSEFESFLSDVFKQLCRATTDTGHIFINYGVALDNAAGIPPAMRWLPDLIHSPFELKSTIIWDKKHATPAHSLHHQQQGAFVHNWEYIFHFATEDAQPLNGDGNDSVWSFLPVMGYSQESEDTGEHPAPFPVELVNQAMEATTDEGDTILDPFMGSGTTAVAAIQNDRDYVGFELDEGGAYKPIIERRIGEAKRQVNANAD